MSRTEGKPSGKNGWFNMMMDRAKEKVEESQEDDK